MRLFITGGCGFIGSHFVRYILENHPEDSVFNFDKLTYAGNPKNLEDVENKFALRPSEAFLSAIVLTEEEREGGSRYIFKKGDIADKSLVETVISEYKPDAIINFAAETHVDRSINDAEPFLLTNVLGVHNLLEIARKNNIGRFIQVSTDEVYGEIQEGAFTENSPLEPRSPYAASKAAGDLLALSYFTTHGLPVMVTRSANAYGTHQYPEKLIPLMVTNLLEDKKVPVYGDGLQMRHWTHVLDHCSGIDMVLRKGIPGNVYNLGAANEPEYTNLDVVKLVLDFFAKDVSFISYVKDRPGHDRRYRVDASKLNALGWNNKYNFKDSIGEVIEWYKSNKDWWQPLKS